MTSYSNFGSFEPNDLNNIEPAISLPVRKRASKPSSLASSTSSTASTSSNQTSDTPHTSPPPSTSSTSSASAPLLSPFPTNAELHDTDHHPGHTEPPMYVHELPPHPYPPYEHVQYYPPHTAYMQHYNPYMHHMPAPMTHMHFPYHHHQHMAPPPHPHHVPLATTPLSASSPSFTPAHLHSTHTTQYSVRAPVDYPIPQPPLSHPQQSQEQPSTDANNSQNNNHKYPSRVQPQQPLQQTQEPQQLIQQQIQPPQQPIQQLQQTQEPQQLQPQPQAQQQPQQQTQPQSQQTQPQAPQTQAPQPQAPQTQAQLQTQPIQQQTPQQAQIQTQPQQTQKTQNVSISQDHDTKKTKNPRRRGSKHGNANHTQTQTQPQQQPQTQSQQAQPQPPQPQPQPQTQQPQTQAQPPQQPQTQPPQQQQPQTQPPHQQPALPAQPSQPLLSPLPSIPSLPAQPSQPLLLPQELPHQDQHLTTSQDIQLSQSSELNATPSNATTTDSSAQPSDTTKQAPKNWASLFTPKAAPLQNNTKSNTIPPETAQKTKPNGVHASNGKTPNNLPTDNSKTTHVLAPLSAKWLQDLSKLSLSPVPSSLPTLQSRGLKNPTNTCFLNVILQSLIHCPPFAFVLSKLGTVELPPSQMPVTDKFVQLYKEFLPNSRPPVPRATTASGSQAQSSSTSISSTSSSSFTSLMDDEVTKNKQYAQSASPMLPELFFDLLLPFSERTGIPYKDGDKVNQQDAQEFLAYILDRMHEEFLLFHKNKEPPKAVEKNDEWEEVGKKNKSSIVLTPNDTYAQSVISHTFGGKQRSSVRKQGTGSKPSVTIQPFYCLHLDIDKPHIKTLEDALDTYMEPEKLEGYTDDVRGVEVQASKHTSLEALPRVLIVHLKRFAYDVASQARKLDKFINYPQKLTIKKNYLSNEKVATDDKRNFSLFAVVEHHGKMAVKGHYTCDINIGISPLSGPPHAASQATHSAPPPQPAAAGEWLNFDDHNVTRVTPRDVQNRRAYLLFYVQN